MTTKKVEMSPTQHLANLHMELRDAKRELEEWEGHMKKASWFNDSNFTVKYTLRNDGGDASRYGVMSLDVNNGEIAFLLRSRIEREAAEVARIEAALEAAKAIYLLPEYR